MFLQPRLRPLALSRWAKHKDYDNTAVPAEAESIKKNGKTFVLLTDIGIGVDTWERAVQIRSARPFLSAAITRHLIVQVKVSLRPVVAVHISKPANTSVKYQLVANA